MKPLFKKIVIILFIQCLGVLSFAQLFYADGKKVATLKEVAQAAEPGSVFVIGELHGHKPHHLNQRALLENLISAKLPISVGMEFFSYPDQVYVDQYLRNEIQEPEFLRLINWSKNDSFTNYKFQVRFPLHFGGWTVALNMPRTITNKVSRLGLDCLNEEERALLPPDFALGNGAYFDRFKEVMQGHMPPEKLNNYFVAQSIWDDTMAWQAKKYLDAHPEQVLIIIVGDFHVAYGGGLPDRLNARGLNQVIAISQVTDDEELEPHPKYGERADFIWIAP